MSSNSNLGYTGYLLRKTIQPYSLRKDNTNFNEFRDKNMIMYINKKVGNTREREGKNLNHQQLQKGNGPSNGQGGAKGEEEAMQQQEQEVDLEQLQREEERQRQDPFYREVIQQMKQNEYTDDFAVVSEENKIGRQSKSKKERSDIEQTLNVIIANQLDQNKIQELFRDYKKISLKDKLNDLKSSHANMAKIQRKIKKDQQQLQNLDDHEKVHKIMSTICQSKNLTIGKILQINEEDIQYSTNQEGVEAIPKVKALEMLQELIEEEEGDNQKNMIKIFKKTQLDNIDIDSARNKLNMTSFKKKNEQTEKLYQQMALNNKKAMLNAFKDPQVDQDKFVRNRDSVKPPSEKVNVFQRLASPEYAKNQEIQQKKIPKMIPLDNPLSQQEICHYQLKDIYMKNSTSNSVLNITEQKHKKKKQFQILNSEDLSINTPQLFITQSNSVPNSSLGKVVKPTLFQNFSGNSQLYTPQKNIDISQVSTDQKTISSKQLLLNRSLSARQTQLQPELTPRLTTTRKSLLSAKDQKRLTQSMIQNEIKVFVRPKLKIQNQLDTMKQRITKLKENKQLTKANKIKFLADKLEMTEVFHHFVENCNDQKLESNKQTNQTKSKLKQLEKEFEEDIKGINLLEQGQINVEVKIDNPNFTEFKKRLEFKRKLINHLIQKVEKKTDILSKYKSKQITQNFFTRLNENPNILES